MIYIFVGIIGFFVIHFFDLVSIKKTPFGAKPLIWTVGFAILTFSLVKLCLESNAFTLPSWITWVGWFLLAISLMMITFALFINLPFRKTYISTGVGDELVKTGLYALARHPGVYWVTSFMFSLVFISESKLMLITAPIYSIINIGLVILQDIYFFPKMFAGYDEYKKETPMLVPNRRSIAAFIDSLKASYKIRTSAK